MSALILTRSTLFTACTRGVMSLPDLQVLYSLELPWVPNATGEGVHLISCVPKGLYQLVLHDTEKHPRSFALVNPDLGVIHEPDPRWPNARTACLLHVANELKDLEGCIGLGMTGNGCTIGQSRIALDAFNRQIPWVAGHTLEIL